ncbi:hypothetical protein XH93_36385 [Bradyrhizobium sp. CCBAU 51753]|nr:hypothetical protein XH93_36385 [Bradyrhizobium sp. CCBAU 51753]
MPSILAFGVNDSLLDIRHLAPLFDRPFGDRKVVNEWYAQVILHSEAIKPDPATLHRPHSRCLAGWRQQPSDQIFRAWQRN